MKLSKVFLLLLFFSCSTKDKTNDSTVVGDSSLALPDKEVYKSTLLGQRVSDTVLLGRGLNYLIVFALSDSEYNSMSVEQKGEYDEGFNDLIYCVNAFKSKHRNIEILQTASRYIKIGKDVLDKKSFDAEFGFVFVSKNLEHKVNSSIGTVREIENEAKRMRMY